MSTTAEPHGGGRSTASVRINRHPRTPLIGRDIEDAHRAATPLELLFDLVFVISFGVAGSEFAHAIAEGHVEDGLAGFGFSMFAVIWAWINFTWFASAFDNDDWIYRLLVMVQMIGVVVLALGLREVFHSIYEGGDFNNTAAVVGYIIMRVPLIAMWVRVALDDPAHARTARLYATLLAVSQVLWTLSLLVHVSFWQYVLMMLPVFFLELAGPIIAEARGEGTPWHPHHIAERYGLLAIIAIGEVLIGTVAAIESLIDRNGWTYGAGVLAVCGVAIAVGMWWIYFNLPTAILLEHNRDIAFEWGYAHLLLYPLIAGVGAGLHVVALYLEGDAEVSATGALAATAVPLALYFIVLTMLAVRLLGARRWVWGTLAAVVVVSSLAVGFVYNGDHEVTALILLTLAPWLAVVAQELLGGRRDQRLDQARFVDVADLPEGNASAG